MDSHWLQATGGSYWLQPVGGDDMPEQSSGSFHLTTERWLFYTQQHEAWPCDAKYTQYTQVYTQGYTQYGQYTQYTQSPHSSSSWETCISQSPATVSVVQVLPPGLEKIEPPPGLKKIKPSWKSKEKEKLGNLSDEQTKEHLEQMRKKLETDAFHNLHDALDCVLAGVDAKDLQPAIQAAIFFFGYDGKNANTNTHGAADALAYTSWAHNMCSEAPLKTHLYKAEQNVRDSLIVRTCFVSLPMGDKKTFMEKLEEAHKNPIGDELYSQLMQSYRKIIWEKFEDAFMSNNKKENTRRGSPRPRRERPSLEDR